MACLQQPKMVDKKEQKEEGADQYCFKVLGENIRKSSVVLRHTTM